MSATSVGPHIVVLSSLFPNSVRPYAGLFIRERMFRVGRSLPLTVVSPVPWFPLQGLIRMFKPGYREQATRPETQNGVAVSFPRFLAIPGMLRECDGFFMAIGAWFTLRRLQKAGRLDHIDAHFAYPDGYAAALLGRWLKVPVTITLRGTETRHARDPKLRPLLKSALLRASHVFAVADALRQEMVAIGVSPDHITVVGNGVDTQRFHPVDRAQARAALGLAADVPVLISVGGLVERKGFHRVIEVLPELRRRFPGLVYLIVGGASAEGNNRPQLEQQVATLGLQEQVRFLGALDPDALAPVLSAADVFVLSTANEGWANVFLEAMACGLPVVTTDVGGNREVVCDPALGTIVPFGQPQALEAAVAAALERPWDRTAIRAHAVDNGWDSRVAVLLASFRRLAARR